MQIEAIGHEESYSVYTVLKSFFWFETVTEKNTGEADICRSIYSENDGIITITTRICYKGVEYVANHDVSSESLTDDVLVRKRRLKDAVKKSAYAASKLALGHDLKWGILTGIRPVKIARDMLAERSREDTLDGLMGEYCLSEEKASLIMRISDIQQRIIDDVRKNDIALYIAIPFCVSRCSYCSFVSHSVEKAGHLIEQYVTLLMEELRSLAQLLSNEDMRLVSIYIGGGTPTSLSEEQLEMLLSCIYNSFDLSEVKEYTLEAGRADTITRKKLEDAKKYGVDRVSINPQTTNDEILAALGRRHTRGEFIEAYKLAREVGFKVINTDVIAGLPGESLESFKNTIDDIVELDPENVTVHTLSVKRGSNLNYNHVDITKEFELAEKMLEYSSEKLDKNGYLPYYIYRQKSTLGNLENVGYGKAGAECLYNIYMMEEILPVFASGAGAVYKIPGAHGKIDRLFNFKYPYEYVKDKAKVEKNHEALKQICRELKANV